MGSDMAQRHEFKRRKETKVGAAAMKVGIAVLAFSLLCGDAIAAPTQYAVDGLAIGTHLNFDSASYREFKCSRSNQFDGLTWCQKTRSDRERRGSYTAAYSLLHSREGNVVYVNRSQEPSFFNSNEAEDDIQRYSRKIGESPRIMKMPHRSGLPDALIAIWGQITLEQLDQESVKLLSDKKGPKRGLLIDFLGNFVRSAKDGLPIYRIDGGPGFVWAASFDQKGRGTLRLAGVDASGFVSPPSPETQAKSEPSGDRNEAESDRVELRRTIEKLQTELAAATTTIADLERAKAAAEAAHIEVAKARLDAETARSEIEQARVTEKAKVEKTIARLEADRAAAYAKNNRWENALHGSIGGMLVVLTASTVGFFMKRQKASGTSPIGVSAQCQNREAEIESYVLSPEIAIAEDAFGRELQEQVAAINATQDETDGLTGDAAGEQHQARGSEPDQRATDGGGEGAEVENFANRIGDSLTGACAASGCFDTASTPTAKST
jgi:hypothetical protein